MSKQWRHAALWAASGAVAVAAGASLYAYSQYAKLYGPEPLAQSSNGLNRVSATAKQRLGGEDVLQSLCMHSGEQLENSSDVGQKQHAGRNSSPLPPATPAAKQHPARPADSVAAASASDISTTVQVPASAGGSAARLHADEGVSAVQTPTAAADGAAVVGNGQLHGPNASAAQTDSVSAQMQLVGASAAEQATTSSSSSSSFAGTNAAESNSTQLQAKTAGQAGIGSSSELLQQSSSQQQHAQERKLQQDTVDSKQEQSGVGAAAVQQHQHDASALQQPGVQAQQEQLQRGARQGRTHAAEGQKQLAPVSRSTGQQPDLQLGSGFQQQQQQQQQQRQQQPLPSPPESPRHADAGHQPLHQRRSAQLLQKQQQQLGQTEVQPWQLPPRLSMDSTLQQAQTQGQAVESTRQHRSFNTARHAPSLDTTVASAAVARSLEVQYSLSTSVGGAGSAAGDQAAGPGAVGSRGSRSSKAGAGSSGATDEQQGGTVTQGVSLAASCAALCVQHCAKLQDAVRGETTVLDIGCGTGGCCFELAASFSHVLGIDGDLLNITAAKELKAQGELCFRPVAAPAPAPANPQQQSQQPGGGTGELQEQLMCVIHVPDEIDRDRVRFWHCPLPQLPPKLQPADAVLVEDVDGHLGPGLQSVCEQLPALVSPEGVCVVVLGAAAYDGGEGGAVLGAHGCASLEYVKGWLSESRMEFVREVELQYMSGSVLQRAHAGVWLQH